MLVAGVYRPESLLALGSLGSERHEVRCALGATGAADPALAEHTVAEGLTGGKFENLNRVLAGAAEYDWLLVVDDDVRLPRASSIASSPSASASRSSSPSPRRASAATPRGG